MRSETRKTPKDLKQLACVAGATLEEDEGYRSMRVFQIVAPKGYRWISGRVACIRVEWAKDSNGLEFMIARQAVDCGLESIPADELYLYAED